jgi:hypothetical protein
VRLRLMPLTRKCFVDNLCTFHCVQGCCVIILDLSMSLSDRRPREYFSIHLVEQIVDVQCLSLRGTVGLEWESGRKPTAVGH